MKYGSELSRRSVPEWRAHNLDYNEVKHLIKSVTSKASKQPVSSPTAQGSAPSKKKSGVRKVASALDREFESIDMFVQLKAGEIDRRLADCNRMVQHLSSSQHNSSSKYFQQRVFRLHQAVEGLARQTHNLSRFVAAQHTGFRKLIKKFRKWSNTSGNSDDALTRFQVKLESPTSFVNFDFASKFLELTLLYDAIRNGEFKPVKNLSEQLPSESLLRFDCEIITCMAAGTTRMLVHNDSLMEVSLVLVRELQALASNSNQKSTAIYLDTPKLEFAHIGKDPAQIRGAGSQDKVLCCPTGGLRNYTTAPLSEHDDPWYNKILTGEPIQVQDLDANRRLPIGWVAKRQCRPYIAAEFDRARFFTDTSLANADSAHEAIWAVLDTNITISKFKEPTCKSQFPYSLLEIRWTHDRKPAWIDDLERSTHLVYCLPPVFSLYAYSIIEFYGDQLNSIPSWYKTLQSGQDFRQGGPPLTPTNSYKSVKKSRTDTQPTTPASSASTPPAILLQDPADYFSRALDTTPNRNVSFRKEFGSPRSLAVRYWNEFDDGEDNDYNSNSFLITPQDDPSYLEDDRVEKIVRASDRLLAKVEGIFRGRSNKHEHGKHDEEHQPLLTGPSSSTSSRRNSSPSSLSEHALGAQYSPRLRPVASYSTIDALEDEDAEFLANEASMNSRRDNVLMFMYLLCFTLSALTIVTLLAAIMSEDIALISVSTIVVIAGGLTFALLLGLLAMVFFLSRSVAPAWWHQTLVISAFFTIVCFGVGGIAFVLS